MTDLERPDGFSADSLQVLREQMAPDAPAGDLAYFARVCNRLDLSPFADQIVLIGRRDNRVGRIVYRHQITVAGRRALATRTGNLIGIEGPVWCGPRERGELVWRDVWDETEPPYCARVLVHVRGWMTPANGTAKWSEFAQYGKDGKLAQLWESMPSHMLGKSAESLALRRGFPDTITAAVADGAGFESPDLESESAVAETALTTANTQRERMLDGARPDDRPTDWQPSNRDQADADKALANWPAAERTAFLSRHRIEDFGTTWPPEAVAEVLMGSTVAAALAGDTTAGPTGETA